MDIVRIINVFLARIINLFRNSTPSTPIPKDEAGTGSRVKISPEVSEALSRKRPVVAIESAMLSNGTYGDELLVSRKWMSFTLTLVHILFVGLPYPQNLLAVKELEAIVRRNGAVPAVVAILDGVPCIGLSEEELKGLAYVDAQTTACRDIAHVIAKRERGGTSVSATMFLANMVGTPIVVNCGISNIPSDLTELGRTSVAVVSTGAILADDTPRMLVKHPGF
ncbi:pseudouridine-5'-phosphate glycosidase-like [Salvia hispanica]|uniref:pseudouridine-5'-phosphate glycosidase-like n=1 Tax=Salvia hispanica TaxID=49212 RepID=UPI0020091E77|nr:pseudouridine-5'-phosphate glycosidase-like [Salvia hispanica]